QVLHACGRRDEADVRAAWAEADPDGRGLLVKVGPFIDRMDLPYAAAALPMTRAGAITMAELTATGTPAVMVPLPHATADHQAANARAVAAAGGAEGVDDAALARPRRAGRRPRGRPAAARPRPPGRHGRRDALVGPPGRRRGTGRPGRRGLRPR